MVRVYIGRLPSRASDRDIEHFFRGYGKISDVIMKNGFGFVEFQDQRDADDAVHDLNGKDMCGERVILEFPRRKVGYNEDRGGSSGFRGGRDNGYRRGGDRQFSNRYSRPCSTRFRLVIDNLSSRYSWQDIKDHIRKLGIEPTYSEAHKRNVNQAKASRSPRKQSTSPARDRSRSPSPRKTSASPPRNRSRSSSPRKQSASPARDGSRSPSPRKRSASPARNRSRSPSENGSPPRAANSGSASPVGDNNEED
uniref:RRM domain-containing protein n=1 Tax=Caenorhabditis japonica TaxID=281687 RepID=A0A8R1HU81_CAEJA